MNSRTPSMPLRDSQCYPVYEAPRDAVKMQENWGECNEMIDAGKCFVRSLARSNASIAEMLNDDAVLEECNAGG